MKIEGMPTSSQDKRVLFRPNERILLNERLACSEDRQSMSLNRFPLKPRVSQGNIQDMRHFNAYLSSSVAIDFSAPQMPTTSTQVSSKFLLKSSSTMLRSFDCSSSVKSQYAPLYLVVGDSCSGSWGELFTPATQKPSRATNFNSLRAASCRLILSKPTSSTVFPLIRMQLSVDELLRPSDESYFVFNASRKLRGGSRGLDGLMKEPAVE